MFSNLRLPFTTLLDYLSGSVVHGKSPSGERSIHLWRSAAIWPIFNPSHRDETAVP